MVHSLQHNVYPGRSCAYTSIPSWCLSTIWPDEMRSSPATGQCFVTTSIAYYQATVLPSAAVLTPTRPMIMVSVGGAYLRIHFRHKCREQFEEITRNDCLISYAQRLLFWLNNFIIFLARDAFVTTNRPAIVICSSICPSGTVCIVITWCTLARI